MLEAPIHVPLIPVFYLHFCHGMDTQNWQLWLLSVMDALLSFRVWQQQKGEWASGRPKLGNLGGTPGCQGRGAEEARGGSLSSRRPAWGKSSNCIISYVVEHVLRTTLLQLPLGMSLGALSQG